MKSSHLTVMVFCHVMLASIVFYFTSTALASPLSTSNRHPVEVKPHHHNHQPIEAKPQHNAVHLPAVAVAAPASQNPHTLIDSIPKARSAAPAPQIAAAPAAQIDDVKAVPSAVKSSSEPILTERKADYKPEIKAEAEKKPLDAIVAKHAAPLAKSAIEASKKVEEPKLIVREASKKLDAPVGALEITPKSEPIKPDPVVQNAAPVVVEKANPVPQPSALTIEPKPEPRSSIVKLEPVVAKKEEEVKPIVASAPPAPIIEKEIVEPKKDVSAVAQLPESVPMVNNKLARSAPVVMGGLGPLHLLATTLCSYQPDKLVADEQLNQLYTRRASVRKSLFEFMSLKFTNLEKLSSRLGYGLQVVPVKAQLDNKTPGVAPSHGWPVVGKCTAYDLKLMGEAAWCECHEGDSGCPSKISEGKSSSTAAVAAAAPVPVIQIEEPAKVASNQHGIKMARSISSVNSFLPSPEESSVISKLLHVSDIKDAPTVESTIYNLNLTQNQLATLEAHVASTQECRRNALRYTKALFNHLAEDQREVSDSWPKLYALISNDDCARKRMIDIVNALSGFRTDTTSIRRDNLEFAFAMDDLRAKVLESEVNVPLTFDRHFIEVEQFLQQSVRLMLANIQPKRAKLTSMRYRSLMYGASQQASDDQCIDLHQRLLARNYPNDCNPTQFGQLPDVLRMTASSLELWSIEKELSLKTAKVTDYPNSSAVGQQKVKDDVNECIANLVAS